MTIDFLNKTLLKNIFILSVLVFLCNTSIAQNAKGLKKVVLDAGHGGSDIGAAAFKMHKHEKDLALDIALRVGKLIEDSLPSLKVVYTRKTDVRIELPERHKIANNAQADLFVSIHVNATTGKRTKVANGYKYVGSGSKRRKVKAYKTVVNRETQANGTETYVLGLHRNSQKEKAIEEFGDNLTEEPGMLDENDPMTQVLIAQYSQTFLSRSVTFAGKVQQNFANQNRVDRGVKQKGLEVLAGSAMPGVLIEIGFINNIAEEEYMNSEAGQQEIAYAIFNAIKNYRAEMNKNY